MQIKIHRGLDQIGGCITEISTETSRVFIDMGQNLPGNGVATTPEEDRALVNGILSQNVKTHQAVVYTHAHEDHVGLFEYVPENIPQYIGEGGKLLLVEKYDLIKKSYEMNLRVVEGLSAANDALTRIQRTEEIKQNIEVVKEKIRKLNSFQTWPRTKPHAAPKAFEIGDIRITPFFNCHSIYDSYMFLIEADGKRIWHTGDYREHGYLGKGLLPTLKRYATNIDVLITEGTMLKHDDVCIHEHEVSRRMASVMDAFKYVVVLASSTDIERLAAIKEAAKHANKPLFINGGYMNRTMKIFTERETEISKGLFDFHPKFVKMDDPKLPSMRKRGFVLISGVNQLAQVENLCEGLNPNDVLFIYSSWDGYYKDPEQVAINPRYKAFREAFTNVIDIHTSGHASKETIQKVINTVQPKEVICIHKEPDASL